MMTYEETLERIHSFNRFGSRLGLERMQRLLELMGNPQRSMKVIHVAGTNGKGSVCRYLYSVLQENGYRTGLYTSPYLERFTERIEYNGHEIAGDDLASCTEEVLAKVEELLEQGCDSPTEFELVTAIAFCYFAKQRMDFLILEVGLGGKGDSTNVDTDTVASAVVTIDFDHMEYLGDTLEKIAEEKAGIIKAGVPVVSGVSDPAAASVIRRAAEENQCELYETLKFQPKNLRRNIDCYTFDVEIDLGDWTKQYRNLSISMIGDHQVKNAICALTILEILKKKDIMELTDEEVFRGMHRACQTGRLELLCRRPYVILDGAHNAAGAAALAAALKEHFAGKRILMMLGVLKDKELGPILDALEQIADTVIATEPDNPRRLASEELRQKVEGRGISCVAIPDYRAALEYALQKIREYDLFVCSGSLYLIGRVREEFLAYEEQ